MAWRKSWSKLNIFGKNGDGICSKRKLLPEERSVLDDYLDLAELSPIRGSICIAKNIGYSIEQLSKILVTPSDTLEKAEKKLIELKIITVDNNRVLEITNWSLYQSEYDRQKPYRVTTNSYKKKLHKRVTKKTSVSVSISDSISSSLSITKEFLEYFNIKTNKKLTLTDDRKDLIEKVIKQGRTIEELKKAVDNFILDDWPERHKFMDLVYCIGTIKKVNNLDKWLDYKPRGGKDGKHEDDLETKSRRAKLDSLSERV